MAVTYGFFNSVDGDRTYNAEDMSHYFKGLVSDGVYESVGDRLVVRASSGMAITVGTGRALIDCHWLENDDALEITLNAADENVARHDYVIVKLNTNESIRSVVIQVVNELPTESEYIKYLILADITVPAGATSISQTNITDYRGTSRCPYVTGLIKQVDTSDLFLQWQTFMEQKAAEFNAWFESLTEDLLVDTYIQKYQNTYAITPTMEINRRYPIGIPEYDHTKDVLFVYVDGKVLVEGVDFTIDSNVYFPDIDGDGSVSATDSALIRTAAAAIGAGEPSGLTPEQELAADANKDGVINTEDAAFVLQFATGAGSGHYTNNLAGWMQYLEDQEISLNAIIPINSAFEAGGQMTFVVLKSRIGSSSDQGIINRLATIVDLT